MGEEGDHAVAGRFGVRLGRVRDGERRELGLCKTDQWAPMKKLSARVGLERVMGLMHVCRRMV